MQASSTHLFSVSSKPVRLAYVWAVCLCDSEPGAVDSVSLEQGLISLKMKCGMHVEPLVASFQSCKLKRGRFSSLK